MTIGKCDTDQRGAAVFFINSRHAVTKLFIGLFVRHTVICKSMINLLHYRPGEVLTASQGSVRRQSVHEGVKVVSRTWYSFLLDAESKSGPLAQ